MTRGKISGHTRFGTSKVKERPILVTRNGCCWLEDNARHPANELPALTTFSQSPTILKSKEGSHLYVDSTQIQLRVEATILSCSNRACPHNPPLPPTKRCRATMYPLVLVWFCMCQLLFASDLETRASLQTVSRIYRFNCVSIASQPNLRNRCHLPERLWPCQGSLDANVHCSPAGKANVSCDNSDGGRATTMRTRAINDSS